MKQTAVEWLEEQFTKGEIDWKHFFDAKEMEKEQIMDAHSDGAFHTDWDENTDVIENAQDYYNETFKQEEQ